MIEFVCDVGVKDMVELSLTNLKNRYHKILKGTLLTVFISYIVLTLSVIIMGLQKVFISLLLLPVYVLILFVVHILVTNVKRVYENQVLSVSALLQYATLFDIPYGFLINISDNLPAYVWLQYVNTNWIYNYKTDKLGNIRVDLLGLRNYTEVDVCQGEGIGLSFHLTNDKVYLYKGVNNKNVVVCNF